MPSATQTETELEEALRQGRLDLRQGARVLRKRMGLTQIDFAKTYGIAPRTYIDFERGAGNPTLDTLEKIGAAFGCQLGWLPKNGE